MPITPYHFGPDGFVGLLFKRWLDPPVFVLANVVVDLEVGTIALLHLGHPVLPYGELPPVTSRRTESRTSASCSFPAPSSST